MSRRLSARLSQFIDRARLREAFLADIVLLQESVTLSDGASRVEQVEQNVAALADLRFSSAELAKIDAILVAEHTHN